MYAFGLLGRSDACATIGPYGNAFEGNIEAVGEVCVNFSSGVKVGKALQAR